VTHDLREAITISDRIKVKNSEEYLEDFRETWRILGEEFV
jgi:ABC-type nitrate/sulfonate/bicarbonate transport system ATPase subunit